MDLLKIAMKSIAKDIGLSRSFFGLINDYTECHIYDESGAHYCLVGIYNEKYILNNDDIGVPIVVDIGYLKRSRIEIVRRLGGCHIEYKNPIIFYFNKKIFLFNIALYKKILSRKIFLFFGKNPPKRMQLLEFLVERSELGYSSTFRSMSVVGNFYGMDIYGHKDYTKIFKKTDAYLLSFVESGELNTLPSGEYKLAPKALISLENYKIEVNRQWLTIPYQILIVFSTLIIGSDAALNVYKFFFVD